MAYIPNDARWYLADVVLEHTVEGDPRNLVHVNIRLVEADSPEQAFAKATALGRESEQVYTNTAGREVRIRFRGLRELNVIHDELEDGAELTYEESAAVPEPELAGWIRPRGRLAAFRGRPRFQRGPPHRKPGGGKKSVGGGGG